VFANLNVIFLLVVSAYAVIRVVQRSEEPHGGSWWRRNEITIVMTLISFLFPMLFELLGIIEYYHPRMQLRLQLGRIMVLNLLNLYSLIWALFGKINRMLERMRVIETMMDGKNNITGESPNKSVPINLTTKVMTTSTTTPTTTTSQPVVNASDNFFTSTFSSITESIFSKVSELTSEIFSTTENINVTEEATEAYDYNNPDYFETEATSPPTSTTNEFIFYDDYGNATEFVTNVTGDLFATISNIVSNIATTTASNSVNLEDYYYSEYNDSIIAYNATIQENIPVNFMNAAPTQSIMAIANETLKHNTPSNLEMEIRNLCWETMFGQGIFL
jgi:hypothetical protein